MAYAQTGWRNEVGSITSDQHGLIILGNSGVGKSFLGNILVGREVFEHEASCVGVTTETEFVEVTLGYMKLAVFNIPGLYEADQERIDLNKKEIMKAFRERPSSVIMYVFGNQKGRIRNEDIVAFNALNEAYHFSKESLALVLNALPKDRKPDFEGRALLVLQKLLNNTQVTVENVGFLDDVDKNDANEMGVLRERLLKVAVRCTPEIHVQKTEINTTLDHLNQMKNIIAQQQDEIESQREKFRAQIERLQNDFAANQARLQSSIDSLKIVLKKQREKNKRLKHEMEERIDEIRAAEKASNEVTKTDAKAQPPLPSPPPTCFIS